MTHIVAQFKVRTDGSGIAEEIPVIITEFGLLQPLIDYILDKKYAMSLRSIDKLVQAVGLLIDYTEANYQFFDSSQALFQEFVKRLYSGTVGVDGIDPSDLYWSERKPYDVNVLVNHITKFSDWMAAKEDKQPLNPWRQATRAEQQLAWAAWHHKRDNSFLKHLKSKDAALVDISRARSVLLKKTPVITHNVDVMAFPEEHIDDLLLRGFIVPGKQSSPYIAERLNLRYVLITLLMHYGGLRVSEPFHLFIHDVIHDTTAPNSALVRVFHPSEGQAPQDLRDAKGNPMVCKRDTYLRMKYRLLPRTEYNTRSTTHAGWKENALDNGSMKFMHVNWTHEWAGELFWMLWRPYMVQRFRLNPDHPFAFVTRTGKPYSIDAFMDAHEKAVKRIGLVPGKMLGTTPHGHRHAYGRRLARWGVSPETIMRSMHHKSMESQLVYTRPSSEEAKREIAAALLRAESEGRGLLPPPNLIGLGFKDVDPWGVSSSQITKLFRRKK